MNEEEIIQELFSKVDINYSTEGIEEAVLQKIEMKKAYAKQKRMYDRVGKVGLFIFLLLCLAFALNIGENDFLYIYLGAPFILILLMFPLEAVFNQKLKSKLNHENISY